MVPLCHQENTNDNLAAAQHKYRHLGVFRFQRQNCYVSLFCSCFGGLIILISKNSSSALPNNILCTLHKTRDGDRSRHTKELYFQTYHVEALLYLSLKC